MPRLRTYARSFAGGEVTPEFFGRIDDAKYQTGLAKCRNFTILPHGPAANRPGFEFVREVKDSTKFTRLIPFTYNSTQTVVIEAGQGYFRFHTLGQTLYSGAAILEVTSPYQEADLPDIRYVQSADVMTLVHPNYAPRELRRLSATAWELKIIQFVSLLEAPENPAAVATPGATPGTPISHYYVVTTIDATGLDEGPQSASATCSNNLLDDGAYNTITWTAVPTAFRYRVYKKSNGLWGYIGQTGELTFRDDNITPDVATTPPITVNPFDGAGNFPGAVSYHEQRRYFAGTINQPQNVWGTKSGTESNLTYSLPTRDDDSVSFRVAAREANGIRHLVPMGNLLLLTASAEWRLAPINNEAITPTSISVRPQSYIGASRVQPVIVNTNMIFGAARGGHMRELAYSDTVAGYLTGDLSLRAPHLFDGYLLTDFAYAKAPVPTVWVVSSSGSLLGFTYVPEQQIGAWHWHDTDGAFEAVAVVAEGEEDALYAVVQRTIDGASKRYVERKHTRAFATLDDCFFVDSGFTYEVTDPAGDTVITGLDWLEGKEIALLVDGKVQPRQTVIGGSITIEEIAYNKVTGGLPYDCDLETLPLAAEIEGYAQGRPKNVNAAWIRVYRSSTLRAGPTESELLEFKARSTEEPGTPPATKSETFELALSPGWDDDGQVFIRQSDPLPLTVVSLSLEVSLGG